MTKYKKSNIYKHNKIIIALLSFSFIYFFFIGTFLKAHNNQNAITFKLNGGRLGDNLLSFCKARWVAYKYNLNFFYKRFPFSEQLMLKHREKEFTENLLSYYNQIKKIKNTNALNLEASSTLYISDIYLCYKDWQSLGNYNGLRDWKNYIHYQDLIKSLKKDANFLELLRKDIKSINAIKIPKEIAKSNTIAVHIRQGSAGDPPLSSIQFYSGINKAYSDVQWPQKFPPLQYYIDQIKYISHLIKNKKLLVYIFTDSKNPKNLTIAISRAVNNKNIEFKYRVEKVTALDDLFAMSYCDYLIRPHSHLSIIAEIIGNHKIAISPKSGSWINNILYITDINLNINTKGFID